MTIDVGFRERVLLIVETIPHGKVLTYGDVATLAGSPRAARAVGGILRGELGRSLPWHRVINAAGRVSAGGTPGRALKQIELLQAEGHRFGPNHALDLGARRWGLEDAFELLGDALPYSPLSTRGR